MAAHSIISTFFHSSPTFSSLSHSPNRKPTFSLFKSLHCQKNLISRSPVIISFQHHKFSYNQNPFVPNSKNLGSCFRKFQFAKSSLSFALDSLLLLCTSLALSFSLFIVDVDSASAFVVTTPRKLQTDELATVRLFQENTPSVVYITNLAIRYNCPLNFVLELKCFNRSFFFWFFVVDLLIATLLLSFEIMRVCGL